MNKVFCLMHEFIIWAALAVIIGTCIYLSTSFGLLVAGTGMFWIARVLKRDEL